MGPSTSYTDEAGSLSRETNKKNKKTKTHFHEKTSKNMLAKRGFSINSQADFYIKPFFFFFFKIFVYCEINLIHKYLQYLTKFPLRRKQRKKPRQKHSPCVDTTSPIPDSKTWK